MSNTVKIHSFALSGHAHRVVLFAAIAGIKHQVNLIDLPAGEHKEAPFLALNPLGQVPVIEDGDVVVSDSNAILVYLAKKYAPTFLPNDPFVEAQIQKFLTLAAGSLAFGPAAARLITVFNAPINVEYTMEIAAKALGQLDLHMQGREFLVGNTPTIADIAIYSYTAHAPEGNVSLSPYPNVQRLLKNIEALDGFVAMPTTEIGLLAK